MPPHIEEHAGVRIANARKLRRLTQQEAARMAGVSASLLSKVERGLIRGDVGVRAERYLNEVIDSGVECGYVCDESGRYQGCVTPASLHKAGARPLREALIPELKTVSLDSDLHELAAIALSQEHDVPVLDGAGKLAGIVSCRTILKQVMERRAA